MVKSAQLQNPERDLQPVTRDVVEEARPREDLEQTLASMRERIIAAKTIKPEAKDLHCLDCFQKGRDAAIRTITGAPSK
jgi:hypothetical protein